MEEQIVAAGEVIDNPPPQKRRAPKKQQKRSTRKKQQKRKPRQTRQQRRQSQAVAVPGYKDPEAWIDEDESAAELGLSPRTMQKFRVTGGGPPFFKFGRVVKYKRRLNEDWALAQVRRSTSDTNPSK